jgi:hypothetical protein
MRAFEPLRFRLMLTLPLTLAAVLVSGAAGAATTSIQVVLPASGVHVTTAGGRASFDVEVPDAFVGQLSRLSDPGRPSLPYCVVRALLPEGHEFAGFDASRQDAVVLSETFVPTLSVAPSDPEAAQVRAAPPLIEGQTDGPFPGMAARYLGTGYWHGRAIASFAVFPFQVDGERLTLFERITLTMESQPLSGPRDVARPERMSPERSNAIRRQLAAILANPRALDGYHPATVEKPTGRFRPSPAPSLEGSPVEYLIVTTEELAAAYQRLADWRTAQGIPTVVRTVEWIYANGRRGVDLQETIRFFIRDAYEKWGVTWVLLGGDTPEIPARYCYNTYYYGGRYLPVDLYYAGLDGSWNDDHDDVWGEPPLGYSSDNADLYAEVYVGRLPTSSVNDADVMIDKIINYETPVDPSYTGKLMMLAEVLFPYPWNPGDDIDVNGAVMAEYILSRPSINSMNITRAYETDDLYPGSIHESRQQALDSLSAGFDQVYHIGHGFRFNMHVGDANVAIPDADTLSNRDRYSNMYLLNCTAVAFDYDCLGEHFLENPNGGAVSIVGACESAFPDASIWYMDEYTRLLFDEHVTHIGETFARSRLPRTAVAEIADNPDRWTHFIYTLLADPAMQLWTAPVDTLSVTHVSSVGMGVNSIEVDASAGGAPAESVLVCLWKDNDDYQYGLTDAGGSITFDFACESPGSVSVVATGRNHGRYQGWFTVGQEPGPFASLAGVLIEDTTGATTTGNDNGLLDAGETVEMIPIVVNGGGAPADLTILKLRSNSPWVTVTDSMGAADAVSPGDSTLAINLWRVEIAASAPDQAAVEFTVTLSDVEEQHEWSDSFARLIHAPSLEFVTTRRDDSLPYGNGNGIIEDGEGFRLYFLLKNYGSGVANDLSARISGVGSGFVLVDSVDVYPDIGSMAAEENSAGFLLSETNTLALNYLEINVTDLYGRSIVDTVEFREPIAPGNLRFDTSLGEDRIYMWWDASPSPDVDRYHIYRATTPGGPYVTASKDLVDHTVFTDMELDASTRYYYVVAAVDESGNESPYSAEAGATTSPPMQPGWPNVLPEESSNSPAVGDIDGDGDLEVIVGNDLLYAWHHDGREVRDGDNNLATWGVFSDQGVDFVGPAALARLDQTPGLEIVAATLTSKQVFCFDYTGAVLPGWPKSTSYEVRAGVVVGDLDGDHQLEIVAIDQDAIMYAWHRDGQEVRDGDGNPATDGVFYRFPDRQWWHYQMPAMCDIDNDGADEIIVGTQDSTLYVLNGDGSDVPGWPVALGDFAGGGVAVGDIDDDGDLEIVCTVKNTSNIRAYSHDGIQLWSKFAHMILFFNPSPALGDLTGDGKLEVVYPASNGMLEVRRYNGTNLPGFPIPYSATSYTESSPILADVSGDGITDIIVGDETKLIQAFDNAGNLLDGFPLSSQAAFRGTPAAVDLDQDGDLELVAVSYDRTVYAWDFDQPYDPDACPWPEFKANPHRNSYVGYMMPTAVAKEEAPVPRARLEQNIPNPFNPVTTIVFYVPQGAPQKTTLTVYDVTGAKVKTLTDRMLSSGRHEVRWNGTNDGGNRVGTGVYFYRLHMPGFSDTKKMVLLK